MLRRKGLCGRITAADADERFNLLGEMETLLERVEPALDRTVEVLPRFGPYVGRLQEALKIAEGGDLDYLVSPRLASVHTVWMELHEDYLQTLALSREEEGSY